MRNGTAKAVLFDRQKAKLVLHGCKARGKTRRSGAHNDHVIALQRSASGQFSYGFDGLPSLLDRIANEAHSAEFAGNEDPRNVCLKIRPDMGNVDSSALRAEDERNCVVGASLAAGAVTDAMRGFNELSLAVDQPENIPFGASANTGATAQTFRWIDFRMK